MPGVTAGVAATAYAGIPVTHRDDASAVAFVTGHEDPEKEETAIDWEALARFPGTLVFYMGVKKLAANAAALIDAGRDSGRARRGGRAGDDGWAAHRRRDPGNDRRGGRARRRKSAGADRRRRSRRAARSARLAGAPPPARQAHGRHPRPGPGQRPRRDAARTGRRRSRAAGDPDRAADRQRRGAARGRADRRVRADLRDQPEWGAPVVRGAGCGGTRCPRLAGAGDTPKRSR